MFSLGGFSRGGEYENKTWDVLIIGAGPAGFTAAIYAKRFGLETLIISKDLGGNMALTDLIENYPGFLQISGSELTNRMHEQVKNLGVDVVFDEVERIDPTECAYYEGPCKFAVKTKNGKEYKAKTVIIAVGAAPRKLHVPGEEELTGRGVSYCATCDGPLFKGKKVIVVGGGNTALQEAMYLKSIGVDVTLVHRRDQFRADKILQDRFKESGIPTILNTVVTEIIGENKVEAVKLKNRVTGEETEMKVDGVFIFIGYEPKTDFVKHLGITDEYGYIPVDMHMRTKVKGIFAAGDITNVFKQIAVAVGQGAIAANSAKELLEEWSEKNEE
ncbi:thioredoxin-disulfide reductase [Thermococcus thioreducens]|uniref:Thioredoxin reductase n=1 Tax=Thermococcus thioreducens TaxID=277988 RepID=A0A0Q2M051_9EURY|nr:thioredoxin-disulfide reductase [Thermococcus thioreducens]ASJ13450.1 thioredoxin-disulfide reductase [Thermococcus thioreducens]KQH81433.1 thioredoxin reductase [Thermococcus thioreducens]SEV97108.1 thioredoxin reductase (NADPH) [Thermococcus thioreducens]